MNSSTIKQPKLVKAQDVELAYMTTVRNVDHIMEFFRYTLLDMRSELGEEAISNGSLMLCELEETHQTLSEHLSLVRAQISENRKTIGAVAA